MPQSVAAEERKVGEGSSAKMRGDVAGAEKDERLRREGIKAGNKDNKLLTSCLCKFQSLLQSATVL